MRNLYLFEGWGGLGFVVVLVLMTVASCAAPALASTCDEGKSLADAEQVFSEPGGAFGYGAAPPREALEAFVGAANSPPALAAAVVEKSEVLAIGVSASLPRGMVVLGFFDERGCSLGAVGPIPIPVVARFFDPDALPVPKPSGPGA